MAKRNGSLREPLVTGQLSGRREALDLLALALPLFVTQAAFAIMKATDSSLLGHTDTKYLEGTSLSDLWTSASGVFIMSGALGVFCAQAYGSGNKKMLGVWLQVALAVLVPISLIVAFIWTWTGDVLRAFGKSDTLAEIAQYYATTLMLCLPLRVFFGQMTSFFSSQKIVKPGSVFSIVSMVLNLVFGLHFVMGIPAIWPGFTGYGFKACPWVTVVVEYTICVLYWWYTVKVKGYHEECWPGWSASHITLPRVAAFLKQYIFQALSLASDFWRVSVLGAIASGTGDQNIAVWNLSYRICWIVLIFSASLANAMGIKIGTALGEGDAQRAKRVTMIGLTLCIGALTILCFVVLLAPRYLGMIFSSDDSLLDLFEESRFGLAAFVTLMNLAVVLERVPLSVGRPKIAFTLGVVGSWVGQVPGAYLCSAYWSHDLSGLFVGSALGYFLLCALLAAAISKFDWQQLVEEAISRSS